MILAYLTYFYVNHVKVAEIEYVVVKYFRVGFLPLRGLKKANLVKK